jgi:hypothetical protein
MKWVEIKQTLRLLIETETETETLSYPASIGNGAIKSIHS